MNRLRSFTSTHAWRWLRWVLIGAAALAVLLTLLSPIVTLVVNHKLRGLDGYEAHVGSVWIAWWRGGVRVRDFTLAEQGHADDLPVAKVKEATLRIAWLPLFKGKIGGAAVVDGAEFNVVKRQAAPPQPKEKTDEALKKAKQKVVRWQDALRHAFPLEITRFELKDGRFRFVDRTHQPTVDVEVKQAHLVITGLGNRPDGDGDPLPADAQLTAVTTGAGALTVKLQLDPLAKQPHFRSTFELKHLNLPPFNSFMLAYAGADVSSGTFEVYMEINAKGGGYSGYLKPFFKDLDFTNPADKNKSLGQRIKEDAMAAVTALLKNDEDNKVATKAPFSGNFDQNDLDIWSTIANLFHNAFVQAIKEGLEGQTPSKSK